MAALTCSSCATFFHDQAEVPGTNQTLIVGAEQGFFSVVPMVWVEENGEIIEVDVVEAN